MGGIGEALNPISAFENTLTTLDPSGNDALGKGADRDARSLQDFLIQEQIRLARAAEQQQNQVFGEASRVNQALQGPASNQAELTRALSQQQLILANQAGAAGQAQSALGGQAINNALASTGSLSNLQNNAAALGQGTNVSGLVGRSTVGQGNLANIQTSAQNINPLAGLPGTQRGQNVFNTRLTSVAPNQGNLQALSQASLGQRNAAVPALGNLQGFANQLAANSGQTPTGAASQLSGLAGLAGSEFNRGAVDLNPQIGALRGNASLVGGLGQQAQQELAPLRQQSLGILGQALNGQTPDAVNNLFQTNPASRDVLERQFNVARQNTTERAGQRGGALSRSLAGLESARATAIAADAAQQDRARQEFTQGLLSAGLGQGLSALQQTQDAAGLSSNILQGAGAQQLQAEGLRQSALGQSIGATGTAGAQQLQGVGLRQNAQGQALQGLQSGLQGSLANTGQNLSAIGQAGSLENQRLNQLLAGNQFNSQLQNQGFNQANALTALQAQLQGQGFNQQQSAIAQRAALQAQQSGQAQANTTIDAGLLGQQFGQNAATLEAQRILQNQQFQQLFGLGSQQQQRGQALRFEDNPRLNAGALTANQAGLEALLAPLSAFTNAPLGNSAANLSAAQGSSNQQVAGAQAQQQALGQGIGTLVGAYFGGPAGAAAGGSAGGSVGKK